MECDIYESLEQIILIWNMVWQRVWNWIPNHNIELMMVDASGCNLHQRLRKDGDEDKRFATTLQTKIRSPLFKSDWQEADLPWNSNVILHLIASKITLSTYTYTIYAFSNGLSHVLQISASSFVILIWVWRNFLFVKQMHPRSAHLFW